MAEIRTLFPRARIGLVEWVRYGDSAAKFEGLLNAYKRIVGEYPAHFHVDAEHRWIRTSTGEVDTAKMADIMSMGRQLQNFTASKGIKFGMTYNGGRYAVSDGQSMRISLSMADLYESHGFKPQRAILESWFDHPAVYVPESTYGTFTNLLVNYAKSQGVL